MPEEEAKKKRRVSERIAAKAKHTAPSAETTTLRRSKRTNPAVSITPQETEIPDSPTRNKRAVTSNYKGVNEPITPVTPGRHREHQIVTVLIENVNLESKSPNRIVTPSSIR